MTTRVTEIPPASPAIVTDYFESQMKLTTDCWDVHESMTEGNADFVLLDVRSREAFRAGHVPGSVSLPHAEISEAELGNTRPTPSLSFIVPGRIATAPIVQPFGWLDLAGPSRR